MIFLPVTVYVDVLIIVNFLVNYFMILSVGKICSLKIKRKRIIIASFIGAISALSIFGNLRCTIFIILKIVLPFLMILVSYEYRSLKNYMINTAFLFCISFIFSGIILAIVIFFKPPNINFFNGFFYFDINPFALFLMTVICYILISIYKKIFNLKRPENLIYKVYIKRNDSTVILDGFLDSGNNLTEPFSGYPAAVCSINQLKCLFTNEEYQLLQSDDLEKYPLGFKLIPYNTVAKCGILKCFIPDEFICEKNGNIYKADEIVIALGDDEFINHDFNIILPKNILFEKDNNLINVNYRHSIKERERF